MNITDFMDTPRICTAIAEWGACAVYILILRRKQTGMKLCAALACMLGYFLIYHRIAGMLPIVLWIPGMAGAIAGMWIFIRFLCRVSWLDAGYCCTRAFVLAELAASLQWQIYVWIAMRPGSSREGSAGFFEGPLSVVLLAVTMAVIYGLLFSFCYFYERQYIPVDEQMNVSGKELLGGAMIALGAFIISNLSFVFPDTPFSSASTSILYVRTLADFGGLVMLIAQSEKREELRMRGENQLMNVLLQRQYDQYRLSIDNVELLRREFHDIKHYMLAIREEENPEIKNRYLSEMENAISEQESLITTGNRVLDVFLTNKSNYCMQNHITFTCMADGSLISFMHVKDICSLFGNALDNAIECVSQFPDPEKRLISLSMFRRSQFVMIQFENYSETPLELDSGNLPRTTKADKQYHGYGLKSIKAAAQKYGGSMTLQAKDHWFTLQVLIPVEEERRENME